MKSIQDEVMSCATFVELVTEFLEDALPSEQRARFEQHLYFCEGCVTYLEQTRTTARLLRRALTGPAAPAESAHAHAPADTPSSEAPSTASMVELTAAFRRWKQSRGL